MSKMKLDEIDHQILDMLIENTRTPLPILQKTPYFSWYSSCKSEKNGRLWVNQRLISYFRL